MQHNHKSVPLIYSWWLENWPLLKLKPKFDTKLTSCLDR